MYNRYIPQPDGTYRRSKVQDQQPRRAAQPSSHNHPRPPQPPNEVCTPPQEQEHAERHVHYRQQETGILSFFKQLLPRDIDTSDLLIILLLLLIAGDCEEDRNNALLTLALYFFM